MACSGESGSRYSQFRHWVDTAVRFSYRTLSGAAKVHRAHEPTKPLGHEPLRASFGVRSMLFVCHAYGQHVSRRMPYVCQQHFDIVALYA